MIKNITHAAFLFAIVCVASCSSNKQTIPPPVKTVAEAKTLLAGKKWQVVSVATISGSQESLFDKESKSATIEVPTSTSLNWLSPKKDKDNTTFIAEYCEKSMKISIALDKDSTATTTGLEVEKQTYSIGNNSAEDEPKGVALFLTQKSEGTGPMGAGVFTTTYYILGANENTLFLLTPNKLNSSKVVYLLEAK